MQPLSALNGHPNRRKVPGVEANTGPLGHGLPIGVGSAIASRLSGPNWRTFVVLGDGELQEGSNWEAAMCAGHRGLDTLTAIVDRNRPAAGRAHRGHQPPRAARRQLARLRLGRGRMRRPRPRRALRRLHRAADPASRVCVIANTIKGKGVSFIEDRVEWHHKVPSPEQVELALKELA